jgi:heme oxygenase
MSVAKFLKNETTHLHSKIDDHLLLKQLVSPDLDAYQYRLVLEAIGCWLSMLKPLFVPLSNAPVQRIDLKLGRLSKDLAALGSHLKVNSTHFDVPTLSVPALWGAHYVIEGSSLGGVFLAPRIETTLSRQDVTLYYRGDGEQTRPEWINTQVELETHLKSTNDFEEALFGASYSFELLYQILDNVLAESQLIRSAQ